MNEQELNSLLIDLTSLPSETEWMEFKVNNSDKIGEYLSGLSNSACIHGQKYGYLVFGVENGTHKIVGTTFNPLKKAKGNEDLEPWLARLLDPRIDFRIFQLEKNGNKIVIFIVQAASNIPVKFQGAAYIRVGSHLKKLEEYPEKQRQIWTKESNYSFEKGVTKYDQTSDEVLSLIDYTSYFELTDQVLPTNKSSILEKLAREKIINKNPEGSYDITNLGALLFAKKLSEF